LKVQQYMSQGTLSVKVQLPQDAAVMAGPQPATQPTTQPAGLTVPRVGQLTFLDNAVQDGSGTIKLRATLPNSDHHFWPGQFVTCSAGVEDSEGCGADSQPVRSDQSEGAVCFCGQA